MKFSLVCRGKPVGDGTKYQLIETLYDDIILEKKLLGERAHKSIRELETQIQSLLKRKKTKLAESIKTRIKDMWVPLLEVIIITDIHSRTHSLFPQRYKLNTRPQ